jgi:hypothetical protein
MLSRQLALDSSAFGLGELIILVPVFDVLVGIHLYFENRGWAKNEPTGSLLECHDATFFDAKAVSYLGRECNLAPLRNDECRLE